MPLMAALLLPADCGRLGMQRTGRVADSGLCPLVSRTSDVGEVWDMQGQKDERS